MVQSAKILQGQAFDWESGKEAMNHLVNEDGSTNWRAAFSADPGITHCPTCNESYWSEGIELECLKCSTHFLTQNGKISQEPDPKVLRKYKRKLQWAKFWEIVSKALPYKKRGSWYWFSVRLTRRNARLLSMKDRPKDPLS